MKRNTLVAFLTITSFLLMFLSERPFYFAVPLWGLLSALCYFDFKTFKLPNILTAGVLILGIIYNIYNDQNLWVPISSFLISSSLLLVISFVYYKWRGQHGLGMGDIKLFAAGAVWLSPFQLPLVLLISSLMGILYFMVSAGRKDTALLKQKIPYGPFLAIAIWLTWLSGNGLFYLIK